METNQSANKATTGRYRVKAPTRGGRRPGAGRPKGSTAMITGLTLIQAIEQQSNRPFEQLLAEGYSRAIAENNNKLRLEYERMILAKVVSDRTTVEVTENEDLVEAKKIAFAEAVAALTKTTTQDKK